MNWTGGRTTRPQYRRLEVKSKPSNDGEESQLPERPNSRSNPFGFQIDRGAARVNQQTEQSNLFSTVTPKKVPEVVYKQLVSLISSGRLKPGERLPSERAMAAEMTVSRQSIREAIHRARTEGLIEVRQGGGTFVIS